MDAMRERLECRAADGIRSVTRATAGSAVAAFLEGVETTMPGNEDNVLSFATPPAPPPQALASTRGATGRFQEGLLGRLGELLGTALKDASSIEVRTFTSASADVALGSDDPFKGARLRAVTRATLDGDTQTVVPVKDGGAVDEDLWNIHRQTLTEARADRASTIAAAISAVQKIAQAVR